MELAENPQEPQQDTAELIDPLADDLGDEEITDPADPSYVEPADLNHDGGSVDPNPGTEN